MATSARNWKKPDNHELQLPSGNTCLVKRPGLEKLLVAGVLPDSLTPIAMDAVAAAQGGVKQPQDRKKKAKDENELDAELMKKFLEKEGALQDIFAAMDKVTAMCVVEPKVEYHMRLVLDADNNPKKDVHGDDVWQEIPLSERISADQPQEVDGHPNPLYSADPPLYTDEIDHADKELIFEFVSGGDADLARFRNSGDDVAAP